VSVVFRVQVVTKYLEGCLPVCQRERRSRGRGTSARLWVSLLTRPLVWSRPHVPITVHRRANSNRGCPLPWRHLRGRRYRAASTGAARAGAPGWLARSRSPLTWVDHRFRSRCWRVLSPRPPAVPAAPAAPPAPHSALRRSIPALGVRRRLPQGRTQPPRQLLFDCSATTCPLARSMVPVAMAVAASSPFPPIHCSVSPSAPGARPQLTMQASGGLPHNPV